MSGVVQLLEERCRGTLVAVHGVVAEWASPLPVGLDGLEGNGEDGLDSGHALVHVTVLLAHPVLQHLNSMQDSRLIHHKVEAVVDPAGATDAHELLWAVLGITQVSTQPCR